ncbi:MAG: helix-turn-helix domain-containing protein [Bacteroidales bacterium]|nr:helix-turn-helix domain-containing protein [Bacteroidales bacterium]
MNTRLKQFLAAENITQSQFADKIEVVRASVSHVLSGRNNPSYEFIKAIMAKYPALNMEWLMFGKGRMYKDSGSETTLPAQPVQIQAHPQDDLLFNDLYADMENDIPETQESDSVSPAPVQNPNPPHSPSEPTVPITLLKDLVENSQQAVKQRKVSKILVLFDDGSFQEL